MPTPFLKSVAKRSHKSLQSIEGYWEQAKADAHKKFDTEDGRFWSYVNALVQRRSGLRECTFSEFIDFIREDEEQEERHHEVLARTGFYGKQGAGCVIVAKDTGRILMPKRSRKVEQPGTWGTWGGAIDDREDPKAAAKREVQEEAGYDGSVRLEPLFEYKHPSGFRYHNFLAIVDHEFEPTLNWETSTAKWCKIDALPRPLHFGLKSVLENVTAYRKLKAACGRAEQ